MRKSSFVQQVPFLQITIPYVIGVLLGQALPKSGYALILLAWGIALGSVPIFFHFTDRFALRGIVAFAAFLAAGCSLSQLQTSHAILNHEECTYTGILLSSPIKKSASFQADCKVTPLYPYLTHKKLWEKTRIYVDTHCSIQGKLPGDSITFTTQLKAIQNRGNPNEFNYAGYMLAHGFRYTGYVKQDQLWVGNNSGTFKLLRWADQCRSWLLTQFRLRGIQGQELAVLAALTTGDRILMSDELKFNYSTAGGMHILAVSGLHVGILYLFLNWLFPFRIHPSGYRFARFATITACLWFYAFLTGLSPSVLRATFMFSFFVIGSSCLRKTSSYNNLLASAFIILVINPLEIYKVGFQFSYLAVLGILFFQPRIESIFPKIQHKPVQWLWQLVTVSIAAQLFTFPLALYYFHQYPVYFLLTNIVLIPAVWLILAGSLLFTLCSPLPLLPDFLGVLLQGLLKCNNIWVTFISSLPASCINSIPFSPYALALTFLALAFVVVLITQSKTKLLPQLLMATGILIQLPNLNPYPKYASYGELILYNTYPELIISIIDQRKHYLITRNIIDPATHKKVLQLQNFWIERGILKNTCRLADFNRYSCCHDGNKLFLLQDSQSFHLEYGSLTLHRLRKTDRNQVPTPNNGSTTYLLVDRESGYPANSLLTDRNHLVLLIHGGMSRKQETAWIDFAQTHKMSWYTLSRGACRIRFQNTLNQS